MQQQTPTSNQPERDAAISARAQVIPHHQRRKFIYLSVLLIVIISMAFIGIVSHGLLPNHANKVTSTQNPAEATRTLEENLAHLRAMVEAEKVKYAAANHLSPLAKPSLPAVMPTLSHELLARMNAPTTLLNGDKARGTTHSIMNALTQSSDATLIGPDLNSHFINAASAIDVVEATRLPHPEYIIAAGEIIPAVLETAIHSDLPGMIRAVVSRDVYSLQGTRRLIPKGARLIGQYSAGIIQGQTRILVVWERIQLTNGIVVSISSSGTDTLGRAGIGADEINHHFMEKFGTSALLSVMGAYAANSGVNSSDQYNSSSAYRMSVTNSFQNASAQVLQPNLEIKPTLQVQQGALINVFVAHDLSFYNILVDGKHAN